MDQATDQQMKNVVKGGYREDVGDDLYIGKVMHEGDWKVSKAFAWNYRSPGLWVWDQNGEGVNIKEFDVLKYNSTVDDSSPIENLIVAH